MATDHAIELRAKEGASRFADLMAAAAQALEDFLPGLGIACSQGGCAEQASGERQGKGQGGDLLHVAFPVLHYRLLEHDS
ncbi:hypothetical protein D3C76_1284920 [compost metagenome]